jgi:hypothetical protein
MRIRRAVELNYHCLLACLTCGAGPTWQRRGRPSPRVLALRHRDLCRSSWGRRVSECRGEYSRPPRPLARGHSGARLLLSWFPPSPRPAQPRERASRKRESRGRKKPQLPPGLPPSECFEPPSCLVSVPSMARVLPLGVEVARYLREMLLLPPARITCALFSSSLLNYFRIFWAVGTLVGWLVVRWSSEFLGHGVGVVRLRRQLWDFVPSTCRTSLRFIALRERGK